MARIKVVVADDHAIVREGVRMILAREQDIEVVGEPYGSQLLRAGAAGYVLKRAAAQDLVQAVRAAAKGEAFLYPSIARKVVEDYLRRVETGEEGERYDGLTTREKEILTLIAQGLSNQQIAEKLYISIKTVQTHRAHILEKLGLHDRTELVRYAIRKGLIQA